MNIKLKDISNVTKTAILISQALFVWHVMMLIFNIESPVVVVLSGFSLIQEVWNLPTTEGIFSLLQIGWTVNPKPEMS